jgi:hypothetical protein
MRRLRGCGCSAWRNSELQRRAFPPSYQGGRSRRFQAKWESAQSPKLPRRRAFRRSCREACRSRQDRSPPRAPFEFIRQADVGNACISGRSTAGTSQLGVRPWRPARRLQHSPTGCRPTRKWNRGRLKRLGETSEEYAQPLRFHAPTGLSQARPDAARTCRGTRGGLDIGRSV